MAGFDKIELETSPDIPPAAPTVPQPTSKPRRNIKFNFLRGKSLIVLIVVVVLIVISSFGIFLPAYKTYNSAKKTYTQAKATLDAIKKQNVEEASVQLAKTKESLAATQKDLDGVVLAKFFPGLNFYYGDAQHLMQASSYGIDAAGVFIDSVKPYADVLGLKGKGSFVMGSAENRIQTAVKTMSKITPRIDEIEKDIALAKEEIDKVNPNRYPGFLGGSKVKNNLIKIRKLADEGSTFLSEAKPLIKILPELLGEPKDKKYMIIFQNDKELRPTGGFITAYSIFNLAHGVIKVERSENIYNLDNTISNKSKAPEPILKYLPNVSLFNLRDSNLSPDFEESMQTFSKIYEKAGAYEKVDGILAVDTQALVAAMDILGDVQAAGMTFSTKNDPRCNCPQVIYQLENSISTPLNLDLKVVNLEAVQARRKDIIGELMFAILHKALSSSPKLYWGPLFQTMLTQTSEKNILFYLYDNNAQAGIRALNAAGKIQNFDGDYFHFNEANFGGQKSNMYVKKEVTQDYSVASDGTITKNITINFKNPQAPSDCNLERGNLCLNAVLRDWFRVYVPKGSILISSKGSEVNMTTYEELGKTVFEGFLTVRPLGSAKFTLSYKLPFKLENGPSLPVLIQKQPGSSGDKYTLNFNNKKKEEFPLLTDKKFVF